MEMLMILGRICIGAMFLWSAFDKVKNWNSTFEYMKTKSIPQLSIVLPIAVIVKILGGLSLVFGMYSGFGAFLLLVVAVPASYYLHPFWKVEGADKMIKTALFRKDLAIVGALLMIIAMSGM